MRFHAFEKSSLFQTDIVCGPSGLFLGLGILLMLIFPAVGIVMLWSGVGMWWVTLFPMLILCSMGRQFIWVCGGNAWLMRWNRRWMQIRLGDLFERDPAHLAVLELERAEIEWVRAFSSTTISKDREETQASSSTFLEIKLRRGDLEELRKHLAETRKPKVWHGWTSPREVPVSVTSEGLIRVEWYGRKTFISPRLKKVLRLLSEGGTVVKDKVSETNDFTLPSADKQKMEQRIVELVESGDLISAIKLARKRYGYSLAEAKQFVDELRSGRGKGNITDIDDSGRKQANQ